MIDSLVLSPTPFKYSGDPLAGRVLNDQKHDRISVRNRYGRLLGKEALFTKQAKNR